MNTGLISSRYANSLLQYAISMEQEEEVYDKMILLSELFWKVPRLRSTIINPAISRQDKKNVLTTACGGNIPSSLSRMIDLILKNEREDVLLYIVLRFIELYRQHFNIQSGKLVTAVEVDSGTQMRLVERISEIVNAQVEIQPVVDPTIIGGFILTLGDLRWDASISGELSRLKKKLQ